MKKRYSINCAFLAIAGITLTGCDLSEKFYSESVPETYFTSPESAYTILARPFSHWEWYIGYSPSGDGGSQNWLYQEVVADTFCVPYRDNADWLDGGSFSQLHYQAWTPESKRIRTAYTAPMEGIARCLAAIEDLSGVNYPSIRLTDADKADHIAQLNALMAYFYKEALDRFGGLPIYTSSQDKAKARNTDKELFEHIEKLFLSGISGDNPSLKIKKAGQPIDGYITRGAAAALLAQLYLNAEACTGVARYDDCAKLCRDIIGGVYGPYSLAARWQEPFGFDNMNSNELIWGAPQAAIRNAGNSTSVMHLYPPDLGYFGMYDTFPWNGMSIQPSRDPATEQIYDKWKLGTPFEKFDDGDLRKQPYGWKGDNDWQGMFMMGKLENPVNPEFKSNVNCKGKNGKPSVVVDYLVDYIAWKTIGETVSDMNHAEANSCYRLVKYPRVPDTEAATRWDAYLPVIRLAEIHYMLAECEMRAGRKGSAATIINAIRKRNFAAGADPNPVTEGNLDKWRMLDEWLVEFFGESTGRRRTDLVRWGAFVTEDWWDHTASNDPTRNRFPIPSNAITGNPLLEQNPGY